MLALTMLWGESQLSLDWKISSSTWKKKINRFKTNSLFRIIQSNTLICSPRNFFHFFSEFWVTVNLFTICKNPGANIYFNFLFDWICWTTTIATFVNVSKTQGIIFHFVQTSLNIYRILFFLQIRKLSILKSQPLSAQEVMSREWKKQNMHM